MKTVVSRRTKRKDSIDFIMNLMYNTGIKSRRCVTTALILITTEYIGDITAMPTENNTLILSENQETRICPKCGEEKPLTKDFFHKSANHKGGFVVVCKKCRHLYMVEYRKTKTDELRRKEMAYHKKNRSVRLNNFKKYHIDNKEKDYLRCKKYREAKADYSTSARKLIADKTKKDKKGNLLVRCKNSSCLKWFSPTNHQVSKRIECVNGTGVGESNFYCSDKCKKTCILYGQKPEDLIKYDEVLAGHYSKHKHEAFYSRSELITWASTVKNNANNVCEACGSTENLQVHHIDPKSIAPEKALDTSNGICLCADCHIKAHNNRGCHLSELRKCRVPTMAPQHDADRCF